MKKHFVWFITLSTAVAGFAYLANRLALFHDERDDYEKYDTSNQR